MLLATSCASTASIDAIESSTTTTTAAVESTASTTTGVVETTTSTTIGDAESAEPVVQAQFDWFVAMLNNGGALTVAEVEERLSPAFLAEIPAEQIVGFIPQIFAVSPPPYTVDSLDITEDGQAADAILVGADGGRLSVQMFAAAEAPHLIEGLGVVPAAPEQVGPVTLGSIDERLAELAPRSAVGVYDVTSGECTAVHEIRTDTPIVLGSIFKLWVLEALAHEVAEGRAAWDETMAVTDELRSSPDGEVYELGTGTEVTLRRLGEAMISISDNTATDMLMSRVGRQAVEDAMARSGVANPEANTPMLSTGNLFALKFFPDEPNADDYRGLDEAGKRALLEELDSEVLPTAKAGVELEDFADLPNADGVPIDQPRDHDIEWFATAADLCRTYVHLGELAATAGLEPVAEILEINPGVDFDEDRWSTVRYKGGSEPGVIATAWWFEGPDGDRYVVAGGVSNPDDVVNQIDAIDAIASAIELIE